MAVEVLIKSPTPRDLKIVDYEGGFAITHSLSGSSVQFAIIEDEVTLYNLYPRKNIFCKYSPSGGHGSETWLLCVMPAVMPPPVSVGEWLKRTDFFKLNLLLWSSIRYDNEEYVVVSIQFKDGRFIDSAGYVQPDDVIKT